MYPESFLAKNRAGVVMKYRMRIYKNTVTCLLVLCFFSSEATSSFAGILYKYILKSKATTPSKPSCLLNSIPNQIRDPGDQFHGFIDLVFVFLISK